MKKTISNIIIFLLISIALGVFPFLIIFKRVENQKPEFTQDTTIIVNDNGKIKVKEKIDFSADRDITNDRLYLNRTLFAQNEKDKEFFISKEPENIIVQLNDKELTEFSYTTGNMPITTYYQSNTGIVLQNLNIEKNKTYHIDFYYEYNAVDIVDRYNNLELLRLGIDDSVRESNITIQLPQKTNMFKVNTNAKTEYLGNNTYNIKGKMRTPYTELLIDKECIKNAKIINEEYEINDIKRTLVSENSKILNVLIFVLIITLGGFIITIILTKKVKIEKNYVRNPEEVIEPILAESMIDRKIGAKELIMSCIVELIYRGNIINIGNEKIQLINEENISDYEYEIISLLFKRKGQFVTFEEIEDMFIDNNEKTQEFFYQFKIIKKKIEKKLIDYNIYSKVGEIVLKILRLISIVNLINVPYMLYVVITTAEKITLSNVLKYNVIAIIAVFAIAGKTGEKKKFDPDDLEVRMYTMFFITGMIIFIWYNWHKHLGALIMIAIIFIFNLIIFIKSNSHVFTNTGKIELARVQGLKNYIIDYSLMKERELDSVIVWDEYLAYAVAFGIPNKITDKFNENLMNTNIVLQKLENILKI